MTPQVTPGAVRALEAIRAAWERLEAAKPDPGAVADFRQKLDDAAGLVAAGDAGEARILAEQVIAAIEAD